MKKISRKSFLKLASAAAMSGITAGALAACNAASGSTAASSAAAKYTPGTYTATAKVHERLHHTGHGRHGSVCPGSF